MVCKREDAVRQIKEDIQHEPEEIRHTLERLLDGLLQQYPDDRVDPPNDTRLFALGVRCQTTSLGNQYLAVVTARRSAGQNRVRARHLRVQVQVDMGLEQAPKPAWRHCKFFKKLAHKEWWEHRDEVQSLDLIPGRLDEIIRRARGSIAA